MGLKYLTILLLILNFAGVGIFGFVFVDHNMQNPNHNCVASAIDGIVCPTGIATMALHHISAVRSLVTASVLPVENLLLLFIYAVLIVSTPIFLFYKDFLLPKLKLLLQRSWDTALYFLCGKQGIVSRLSLFERSPSL